MPTVGDAVFKGRILGGKIEFSGRTPARERTVETGWRRRLDSNAWLRSHKEAMRAPKKKEPTFRFALTILHRAVCPILRFGLSV